MNKKGFTLVELLITIVIVGIVASLASYGAISVSNATKKNLLTAKIELIESGATSYGEDYPYRLTDTCNIDHQPVQNCLNITVFDLIEEGYISSTETCNNIPCLKNNVTGENMATNEVAVYKENNRIYATYIEPTVSGPGPGGGVWSD